MAATDHLLPLLLLSSFSLVLGLQEGFISIDCGAEFGYDDEKTGISYVTDSSYIHTGENHKIPENIGESATNKQLQNLRSFPEGKRNCYSLEAVSKDNRYIILRAFFLHGNYDGEKDLPTFHLYVGTNLWSVVQVTNASQTYWYETIFLGTGKTISVCLLNINKGRPFISALELRHIFVDMTSQGELTSSISIATVARMNFGGQDDSLLRAHEMSGTALQIVVISYGYRLLLLTGAGSPRHLKYKVFTPMRRKRSCRLLSSPQVVPA